MDAPSRPDPHQSPGRAAGCWTLAARRALSLRPRERGVLRIEGGLAWVTLDGPHAGPPGDQGDLWLGPGDTLVVAAGRRVVLESRDERPVTFQWDFAPQPQAVPLGAGLAQDWCELRQGLGLALGAGGRLATGLARIGWRALRPRVPGVRPAT